MLKLILFFPFFHIVNQGYSGGLRSTIPVIIKRDLKGGATTFFQM